MFGLGLGGKCKLPDNCFGIGNPRADYFERKVCGGMFKEKVDDTWSRTVRKDVMKGIGREFKFNGRK